MQPLPEGVEAYGVLLRCWRAEDAPAMHEAVVASTEHLRPWMAWISKEPLAVPERVALIHEWERLRAEGGDAVYGIWRDGVVVGGTGLHRRIGEGALEIGYWVHVDHVREGVATAASRAATDLAFTVPGNEVVEIHHDVQNEISGRVPAALGYHRVGVIDANRAERAPWETGKDVVWRMTRSEWLGLATPDPGVG